MYISILVIPFIILTVYKKSSYTVGVKMVSPGQSSETHINVSVYRKHDKPCVFQIKMEPRLDIR